MIGGHVCGRAHFSSTCISVLRTVPLVEETDPLASVEINSYETISCVEQIQCQKYICVIHRLEVNLPQTCHIFRTEAQRGIKTPIPTWVLFSGKAHALTLG